MQKNVSPIANFNDGLQALIMVAMLSFLMSSCFEEEFVPNANVQLVTSLDTVRFDTVFTTVGSVTKELKIINPSTENITIDEISLQSGAASKFRINVDGASVDVGRDVRIRAGDSIYVFVEVTVDPDDPVSESPFVIEEYLDITSGSAKTSVLLEAWGQNANYFPNRTTGGQLVGLTCQNSTINWDDPKPYVVYGLLFIDSCTLAISPGTQVYVHGGIAKTEDIIFEDGGLFFLENGNLLSLGSVEEPVVFQTDRLEDSYAEVAGQWAGVRFLPGSKDNYLQNTHILNSIVGVRADSAADLNLENVVIGYASNVGIIGSHATITAKNTLVHSTGGQSVAFTYGGEYDFSYCTLANYENQSPALYADNFTCRDAQCDVIDVEPLNATFTNCILAGSNMSEIDLADITQGADESVWDVVFDHSIVRTDGESVVIDDSNCYNCLDIENEPLFLDQVMDDFRLDTMSVARDIGMVLMDCPFDILGTLRDTETPDVGCYELGL